jgi:hypothetical protein
MHFIFLFSNKDTGYYVILKHEQARSLNPHKGRMRMFYLILKMSRLVLACSTKFFKIQVNLVEKIQVKVYANQEKSLAGLKMLATLMISIVFCSLIIHDFFKYNNSNCKERPQLP